MKVNSVKLQGLRPARLISVTGNTNWSYAYDANGNRTAASAGSAARGYTVATASNRLDGLTSPSRAMLFDAAGNTQSDIEGGSSSNYTATYSLENRLASMVQGTSAGVDFTYDAHGRRVTRSQWTGSPSNPRTVTLYAYDQENHLIGEYNGDGSPIVEYIWLGDIPVAMITASGASAAVYAIHTDHLNTPRVVMDASWRVRWRWMGEPFGASAAEEQPTSGLAALKQNLRFPGQQYEAFGGRFYNHFRDYDPTTGRYVQSDPIGLQGGINTYAYVNGRPTLQVDSDGLTPEGARAFADAMRDYFSPRMPMYPESKGPTPEQQKCMHDYLRNHYFGGLVDWSASTFSLYGWYDNSANLYPGGPIENLLVSGRNGLVKGGGALGINYAFRQVQSITLAQEAVGASSWVNVAGFQSATTGRAVLGGTIPWLGRVAVPVSAWATWKNSEAAKACGCGN